MHRMMKDPKRRVSILLLPLMLMVVLFSAGDCDETKDEPKGQQKENSTRQSNYERLVDAQPAATMEYSPTRDTKNFWIKTWGTKGKVSYIYYVSNGKPWAFGVAKRLPVTYCVGLVRPVEVQTFDYGTDAGGAITVPAPSIDGTYGSSSNCNTMYYEDATTGAYVEITPGNDTTVVLRDQPLPLNLYADALPLGDTTAQQASGVDDE